MVLVAGVDEAGRGPCLGPLVMAVAVIDESKERDLIALGVKDSKLVSAKKRVFLYPKILSLLTSYHILISYPPQVDHAVMHSSLNKHEQVLTAKMLAAEKNNVHVCVVDCPSLGVQKYQDELQAMCKTTILCEHRADANYPAVAAASILAKVWRDKIIDELKLRFDVDFGSGYASDPKTQAFVTEHYASKEFAHVLRQSWETIKRHKVTSSQSDLGAW